MMIWHYVVFVLSVIAVMVAIVLIIASMKPDLFRVERRIDIKAKPEIVFALINDFHQWVSWSPWENLDPQLQRTYRGQEQGPGSVYEWQGNNKVGQGRMEIIESTPSTKIVILLDFIKPFQARNQVTFSLEDQGQNTQVTWSMVGANPFISKVFTVFVNMDKLVGKDFEKGLASMKAAAEGSVR